MKFTTNEWIFLVVCIIFLCISFVGLFTGINIAIKEKKQLQELCNSSNLTYESNIKGFDDNTNGVCIIKEVNTTKIFPIFKIDKEYYLSTDYLGAKK